MQKSVKTPGPISRKKSQTWKNNKKWSKTSKNLEKKKLTKCFCLLVFFYFLMFLIIFLGFFMSVIFFPERGPGGSWPPFKSLKYVKSVFCLFIFWCFSIFFWFLDFFVFDFCHFLIQKIALFFFIFCIFSCLWFFSLKGVLVGFGRLLYLWNLSNPLLLLFCFFFFLIFIFVFLAFFAFFMFLFILDNKKIQKPKKKHRNWKVFISEKSRPNPPPGFLSGKKSQTWKKRKNGKNEQHLK